MVHPSGLTIIENFVLISDNSTGIIHAFDLDGTFIDQYETGLEEGALMGIYASSLDDIWYVDAKGNGLWRLQSQDQELDQLPTTKEY